MDIRTVFGVPAHPLLVHLPVIGIPVAFLMLILFIAMPAKRSFLWWAVGVLTVGVTIATVLTAGSGEQLEGMLPPEDRQSALLQRHTQLGDQTQTIVIVFALVTLAFLGLYWLTHMRPNHDDQLAPTKQSRSSGLQTLLVVLGLGALVLGGLATTWDVRTGHAGAKSAWGDVAKS